MDKIISIGLLYFCLISCAKDSIEPTVSETFALESVFSIASNLYYWNKNLPKSEDYDFEAYNTPEAILKSFRSYSTDSFDRWSFAIKVEAWKKMINGTSGDFGIGLRFLSNDNLYVAYVQPNSIAGTSGLKRGNKVISMNGIFVSEKNLKLLNEEFVNSQELTLEIQGSISSTNVTLKKGEYQVESVLEQDIYDVQGLSIGYLHLFTFSGNAIKGIDEAFDLFESRNIEHLILDLRYNGGGLLSIMEHLANKIVCSNASNKVMYEEIHNDIYRDFDSKVYFQSATKGACLKSIYFITTNHTGSASEVLINSLRPFIDINLVGSNTHGKLIGMHPVPFNDYILVPAAFKIVNDLGEHDDFKGFASGFPIFDGVDTNWGPQEVGIFTAINDIIGGTSKSTNSKEGVINRVLLKNTTTQDGAY